MTTAYSLARVRRYYDRVEALRLDELIIEANTTTALVGPNGSGKSTLLDILAFINLPATGSMQFFGETVDKNSLSRFRRQVGYVQQKPYLFNLSVSNNIELGLKLRNVDKAVRHNRAMSVIEQLGLGDLANRRAHELSGGEIQKVAVARAMVLQPRVLLLDEPFTHLDRNSRRDLEQWLLQVREVGNQTIVFSSHDSIQAHLLADKLCSLMDGRVVPVFANNLFKGRLDRDSQVFDTGRIRIHVPVTAGPADLLAIDSTHLVLSRQRLESSMRNAFQGVVKSLREEASNIHVTVNCGELFHILITPEAWRALEINIGDAVWVSFKSTAITLS